jgi:hypothetical protein
VLCGQVGLLVLLVIDNKLVFLQPCHFAFRAHPHHVSVGRHHALHAAPQLVL